MNLTELLQAIADAIRTKKGTTETINAQDFPTEIANLQLVVASCAISGDNKVGSTLTCSTGDITSVSYQWYRGNNAISNATGKTYTLTGSDVGNAIKCKATTSGYSVWSNTSGTIDYVWTSFEEAKSASSSSHYGVDLTIDSSYLSTHKFSKIVVYTADRERTGDSFIRYSLSTINGDSLNSATNSGIFKDGTTYSSSANTHGYTITFSKPISLSSLTCSCGSGVGQWRDNDTIKMTMSGLKR